MNEERPIEKLLRRYAKKRREEAGAPELHPATRRLLQGEVARQFPKPSAPKKTSFVQMLKAWLPRLGWSTALIVVFGVVAVTVFKGNKASNFASRSAGTSPVELAKNEPAPEPTISQPAERDAESRKQLAATPPASAAAPAFGPTRTDVPAPAPSSAVLADEAKAFREVKPLEEATGGVKSQSRQADKDTFANKGVVTLDGRGAPQPSARSRTDSQELASIARRSSPELRAEPSQSTGNIADAKASSEKLGFADAALANRTIAPSVNSNLFAGGSVGDRASGQGTFYQRSETALKAQNISQAYANTESTKRFKASGDVQFNAVLENFRIEQAGNQLRVIDGDGSTYLGTITPTTLTKAKMETKGAEQLKKDAEALAPRALTTDSSQAQLGRAYLYRVSGTNRTLNQHVEFSWNFVPTNTVLMQEASRLNGKIEGEKSNELQLLPSMLQNSEVSGEIKLDATRSLRIQATPVK